MQVVITTNLNLEEEIKAIRGLEAKIKEYDEMKKAKESEIKKLMDKAGVEELNVAGFVIRYTKFIKNQFDSSKFKKLNLSLYNKYIKQVNSSKFTIS